MDTLLDSHNARQVRLSAGSLRIWELGEGPPLVFVHGLLVNANLWRKVVRELAPSFRCVVPDWPLGSHVLPMAAGARLDPPQLAALIAELCDALGLEDVTLVANDTGGALAQIAVTERPERFARLVLATCDAFDVFPPRRFAYLKALARLPGGMALLGGLLRSRLVCRGPLGFAPLVRRSLSDAVLDAYRLPATRDAGVRRDLAKVMRGISPRYTQEAARRADRFRGPVLLAWAEEDFLFPLRLARGLADAFPRAELRTVRGSGTFIPEDQPRWLAEEIRRFVGREGSAAA